MNSYTNETVVEPIAAYQFSFPSQLSYSQYNPAFLESTLSSCFSFKYLVRRSMQKKVAAKAPVVTSVVGAGSRRRLNYSYDDGSQMIEEYDMRTNELLTRLTKKPKQLGQAPWLYEVGEAPVKPTEQQLLKSSNNNPIFIRQDKPTAFQWRIRNLPYPTQTYIVDVDTDKQQIVIRTTNKKYYKRFEITDMRRIGLPLKKDQLSWQHQNSCLVVTYRKPQQILKRELDMRRQFQKMNAKKPREGDIECSTQ